MTALAAFLPDRFAAAQVEAGEDAPVAHHVEMVADRARRGARGGGLAELPRDVRPRDVPLAVGSHGHHAVPALHHDHDDTAGEERSRGGVEAAMVHLPEFASGQGVIRHRADRGGAHELPPARVLDDRRRAVGLLEVAVVGPVVDRAVGLPRGPARRLLEGHHVLHVEPVEVHDEQVVHCDR